MDDQSSSNRGGRPKVDVAVKRDKQIKFLVSDLELSQLEAAYRETINDGSMPFSVWARTWMLDSILHSFEVLKTRFRGTQNQVSSTSKPPHAHGVSSTSKPPVVLNSARSFSAQKQLLKPIKPLKPIKNGAIVLQAKRPPPAEVKSIPRTRAPTSARPKLHIAKSDLKLDLESKTAGQITEEGFSLRSNQTQPAAATNSESWDEPEPSVSKVKLSTGETVNNTWLYANACRIPPADVHRILTHPGIAKVLRGALISCFAASIRKVYIMRWCSAHNRRYNSWADTGQSRNAFRGAGENLAMEYARRGMTADTYLDAAVEMKPASLKFPTVAMIGRAFRERIEAWIPREQRERNKSWTAHVDNSGTTWAEIPGDDGGPVMVIRNREDQAKFLKLHKVR